MSRAFMRVIVVVALALPGLALAMSAEPLVAGPGLVGFGLLFAFALPTVWLISRAK
jgi:hypothetical protein